MNVISVVCVLDHYFSLMFIARHFPLQEVAKTDLESILWNGIEFTEYPSPLRISMYASPKILSSEMCQYE